MSFLFIVLYPGSRFKYSIREEPTQQIRDSEGAAYYASRIQHETCCRNPANKVGVPHSNARLVREKKKGVQLHPSPIRFLLWKRRLLLRATRKRQHGQRASVTLMTVIAAHRAAVLVH